MKGIYQKMRIQKNQEYIVDNIDNDLEGEGIANIDNFTIYIKDVVDVT